jgi:replicative DNA helicase
MEFNTKYSFDCLIGVERAILSTLISYPEVDKINEAISIIDSNDFYFEQHGFIFNSIIDQYKNDRPIDEKTVYLKNQVKIQENFYIDVITTTPLSSLTDYLKMVKIYSLERQITVIASKIKEGNFQYITDLQILQDKIQSIKGIKDLKLIDDKFEAFISRYDLNIEKIKNKQIEFLYDDFIIKNDITSIISLPGVGKSLITISLCNMLLNENKIERVLYLDGDNSEVTLNSRNIHILKEKFGNRLNYFVELNSKTLFQIINELKKKDLKDFLIIFDSIKNFVIGDRNNHKDVTELMNILKELRKNNATIIFLHHQGKLQKDFNPEFAGSSAFAEDIASSFILKKNEDKQTFILIPSKNRNNTSNYIAFKYNPDNTLTKVDVDYAMETKEDSEIKEEIIRFINSCKEKPKYSDILSFLIDTGFNKDKANKIIQSGKDKNWKATRIPKQNNKLVFELLNTSDSQDNQDNTINRVL